VGMNGAASKGRILAAIDTADLDAAAAQAARLGKSVEGVKLGLEFYMAHGAPGYRKVAAALAEATAVSGPAPIFLDLKFHDIPNTVAGAVRSVAPLQPLILNVHASGGLAMLRAAADAAAESAEKLKLRRAKVIAVTVLTSLDDVDLRRVGQSVPASDQVLRLADLTREAGLDGVVCSPQEAAALRASCGRGFCLVTPGVRPAQSAHGDQRRVLTPRAAIECGADYLVIGRPITEAADPAAALAAISAEVEAAVREQG